jgi:hypothetical protein
MGTWTMPWITGKVIMVRCPHGVNVRQNGVRNSMGRPCMILAGMKRRGTVSKFFSSLAGIHQTIQGFRRSPFVYQFFDSQPLTALSQRTSRCLFAKFTSGPERSGDGSSAHMPRPITVG